MWAKYREIRRNKQYPGVTVEKGYRGRGGCSLAVQLLVFSASTAVGVGQSLVWERISHKLCSVAKKKKKERGMGKLRERWEGLVTTAADTEDCRERHACERHGQFQLSAWRDLGKEMSFPH